MDCDVERVESSRPGRRRASYVWRCKRRGCYREFPYEAVLNLTGCKSQDRRGVLAGRVRAAISVARHCRLRRG